MRIRIDDDKAGFADRKAWLRKLRPLCEGVGFEASPARESRLPEASAMIAAGAATAATARTAGVETATALAYAAVVIAIAILGAIAFRKLKP